jgi:hypothetical protein
MEIRGNRKETRDQITHHVKTPKIHGERKNWSVFIVRFAGTEKQTGDKKSSHKQTQQLHPNLLYTHLYSVVAKLWMP